MAKSGWRIKGSRVYHVKGKRKSLRKTYRSKSAAVEHLTHRKHRKHKR